MEIKEIPRGQLSTIILSTLLDGDKYGYEIIKEIEDKSGGNIKIKQPSLYSSLTRMENQKLINSYWRDSDIGGRRHYYSLTDYGRKQTKQWQDEFLNSHTEASAVFTGEKIEKTNLNDGDLLVKKSENSSESISESPTFLQQENLFAFTEKKEASKQPIASQKNSEETLPDQLDFFSIKKEEPKVVVSDAPKEELVTKEEFVAPPVKHYNVYSDLNSLRREKRSFAQSSSDYSFDEKTFEKQADQNFDNQMISQNSAITSKEYRETSKIEPDLAAEIDENSILNNSSEVETYTKLTDEFVNSLNLVSNNISETNEENESILDNEINSESQQTSDDETIDANEETSTPASPIKPVTENESRTIIAKETKQEIKDDGVFITDPPNPDLIPKVKKIEPARFTMVADSSFLKYSAPENSYNELVEELYSKGTEKISDEYIHEGYKSYDALEVHYKEVGLKFSPFVRADASSTPEKPKKSDEYIPVYKFKFIKNLFMFAFVLISTWLCYTLLSVTNLAPKALWLYIGISIISAIPCCYYAIMQHKYGEKQLPKEKQDKTQLFINLGIMIAGIVLVVFSNMLFGMTAETFTEYSTTVIYPIVLLLALPMNYIAYNLFLNKF